MPVEQKRLQDTVAPPTCSAHPKRALDLYCIEHKVIVSARGLCCARHSVLCTAVRLSRCVLSFSSLLFVCMPTRWFRSLANERSRVLVFQVLMCDFCYNFGDHKRHKVSPIADVAKTARAELTQSAARAGVLVRRARSASSSAMQRLREVGAHVVAAEKQIDSSMDELVRAVNARRVTLKQQLSAWQQVSDWLCVLQ